MAQVSEIKASVRTRAGTGDAREVRRQAGVPAARASSARPTKKSAPTRPDTTTVSERSSTPAASRGARSWCQSVQTLFW